MTVVDSKGTVKESRVFNTFLSLEDSKSMKDFLSSNEVKPSDIVLITSCDSINTYLPDALPGIRLLTCGKTVSDVGLRDTLTIIGRKAAPCPPWFFLKHAKAGQGPVVVTKNITTEV